ncbi:alanine racemase [Dubosiella newyorkensis]|uniref:alanine racemase n=1 Tax=Dubosiella newyorkensis TaxID=1862672 RepID=UPI00272DCECF|nr:alanine racemase [Dubosiella newyorkensis]
MLEAYSRAWCEIDYDTIEHNLKEIQKLMNKTKVMGIVKANAYGLGALPIAKTLRDLGIDYFGVSSVDEAIELREGGIQENILILGYTPPEHFSKLVEYDLVQSFLSEEYAKKLNDFAKAKDVVVRGHLKLDTGMNRTGIPFQDGHKEIEALKTIYELPYLRVEGIFSHFPVSDDLGHDARRFTKHQIELFEEAISYLKEEGIYPGLRHIQNSYGILNYGDLGFDYCRPGLLFNGMTSDDSIDTAYHLDLKPILTLKANVSLVKWIKAGESVSYGRHFIAQKPTKVATLSIGYADGLSRLVSNQGLEVLLHGKKAKLIGNICMDQCMADVTEIEGVQEGDEAVIVGEQEGNRVTIDRISRMTNTINNETLTSLASRLPRLPKK